MTSLQEKIYTIEDIYNLPKGTRAELIDGQIFYIATPDRVHQKISLYMSDSISNYIHPAKENCTVYTAPSAAFLDKDGKNYYEPDISVIYDSDKPADDSGFFGTPDWVIEITSPRNPSHDYFTKLYKYQAAGVREYWVVSSDRQLITVCLFNKINFFPRTYTFQEKINVKIFPELTIDFSQLAI